MEYVLTKNADCLLALLYALYKQNVKTMPEDKARLLGNASDLKKKIGSKFTVENILSYCWELYDNKLIYGGKYSNTLFNIELQSTAIAYMENRKSETVNKLYKEIKEWSVPIATIISGLGFLG